jgi:SpoVK/Ycf46/Vps4 family AAA+-type ATPase
MCEIKLTIHFYTCPLFKVHCCEFTVFIVQASAGYSGSDIKLVCKEAAMNAMREAFYVLETCQNGKKFHSQFAT